MENVKSAEIKLSPFAGKDFTTPQLQNEVNNSRKNATGSCAMAGFERNPKPQNTNFEFEEGENYNG